MVIYSVFKSLGLKTEFLPLLDMSPLNDMDEQEYEDEEDSYRAHPWSLELDDYDYDNPVCDRCAPGFPSIEEWKAKQPRVDRIGTGLHDLKWAEMSANDILNRDDKEEVRIVPFTPAFDRVDEMADDRIPGHSRGMAVEGTQGREMAQ